MYFVDEDSERSIGRVGAALSKLGGAIREREDLGPGLCSEGDESERVRRYECYEIKLEVTGLEATFGEDLTVGLGFISREAERAGDHPAIWIDGEHWLDDEDSRTPSEVEHYWVVWRAYLAHVTQLFELCKPWYGVVDSMERHLECRYDLGDDPLPVAFETFFVDKRGIGPLCESLEPRPEWLRAVQRLSTGWFIDARDRFGPARPVPTQLSEFYARLLPRLKGEGESSLLRQ